MALTVRSLADHTARDQRSADFGSVTMRDLDWDTKHFGRRMAALALTPAAATRSVAEVTQDLRSALASASERGYAHVMLRVPAERLAMARAAEQAGLRLVDIGVDLSVDLAGRRPSMPAAARPASVGDLDALRLIASTAFEISRFSADPFFNGEEVSGLYRQWVTNLCAGLARAVLVVTAGDEVAGFTSCAVQDDGSGRIPLIATSEDHRRQGIGRALVEASLAWFVAAGIGTVWVKTQSSNYPALALYHRSGFAIAASELTFTVTLKPTDARS